MRDSDWVYRHRWLTLMVLCVSLLIIVLDNTILNIALPTLAKEPSKGGLGASPSQLQYRRRLHHRLRRVAVDGRESR